MKSRLLLLTLWLLGMASTAFAATSFTFNATGGNIPDWWATSTTLTVNFTVTGVTGDISDVTVALVGFSGNKTITNCRVDLMAFGGPRIKLFDAIGPLTPPNGTFTFDDSAATAFSGSSSASGGTYRPQDSLSVFDGLTPIKSNVVWSLDALAWNRDASNQFTSATLIITTIPEPSAIGLLGVGGLLGLVFQHRLRRRKNSV